MLTPLQAAEKVVRALDSKKGKDIRVLHTHDVTILADYFVLCTAGSTTQVKTLADFVEKEMRESGETPLRVEGEHASGWVLIDFGAVIVHIFMKEARDFYALERLWQDAPEIDISPWISEEKEKEGLIT
ncbi:MAG: ribosome silencing factor [Clostridiales bacterium]|nr:ribosome silencing factor [Clostridiales bacterium]